MAEDTSREFRDQGTRDAHQGRQASSSDLQMNRDYQRGREQVEIEQKRQAEEAARRQKR